MGVSLAGFKTKRQGKDALCEVVSKQNQRKGSLIDTYTEMQPVAARKHIFGLEVCRCFSHLPCKSQRFKSSNILKPIIEVDHRTVFKD